MNPVARALWNPIVAKEYRTRMRTWRSPFAITLYVVLLGGLGWAVFAALTGNTFGLGGSGSGTNYGQYLFMFLIIFQVALLGFITPALTSGAISSERERQTLDLLFVTPLAPFSIIWGKLLASMSFVALLLILSIPLFSLVFLLGGIELDQVAYAFVVTGATALTLGLVGIAFSSLFRRTLPATVAAYGAAFVLLLGTYVFGYLFPTDADPNSTVAPAPPAVTLVSPVIPLVTIATNQPASGYGVRYDYSRQLKGVPGGFCSPTVNGVTCSSGPAYSFGVNQSTGTTLQSGLFKGWQYWQASVVMQLMICAVALAFSALILPPVRRFRPRWRRAAAPAPA
jgi:ABC-2 type transport system permease protein